MVRLCFCLALLFGSVFLVPANGLAEESAEQGSEEGAANFRYETVTTSEGLTFRVPEDMPIEKRNGIVAPIPFDEYMYGKFAQLDQRMKSIEMKIDRIEALLSEKPKEEKKQRNFVA